MDLGSTKTDIVASMACLPPGWEAVGGHPMCGKAKSSLENADGALFRGATFALAAIEKTGALARRLAEDVVEAVGARALWVDAAAHDRSVAATSHLPFLMASALAACTPADAAALVGPGFRGAARLAASSAEMMVDILATNRENVRAALADFRARLDQYDNLLEAGDYAGLALQFAEAAERLRLFEPQSS
jgi:prephenate dehydrogenase